MLRVYQCLNYCDLLLIASKSTLLKHEPTKNFFCHRRLQERITLPQKDATCFTHIIKKGKCDK
jgi:hypothetical protein